MEFKKLLKIFEAPAAPVGSELAQTSGGQFMNKADRLNQAKVDAALGPGYKAGRADTNLALAKKFRQPQPSGQAAYADTISDRAAKGDVNVLGTGKKQPAVNDPTSGDYTVNADPNAAKVPFTPRNTTGYSGVQQHQYVDGKPNPNYDSGEKPGTSSEVPVPANIGNMSPEDSTRELNAARVAAGQKPVGGTVGSGTNTTWTDSSGKPITTDSPEEIARRGPMGIRLPDPAEQRAQGEKNWNAIKSGWNSMFGGNKSSSTPTPPPAPDSAAPPVDSSKPSVQGSSAGYAPGKFSEDALEEEMEKELEEMMRLSGLSLNEKAVSTSQQQMAGAELERRREGKKKSKKGMGSMSTSELKKFAGTKHKGLPKHVTESTELMDETRETLKHIANRFKYETKMFMQSGHMDQDLFHSLYDYYKEKGDMPYSVAKGDAQPWVESRFYQDMGSGMSESMGSNVAPAGNTLSELARLAGLTHKEHEITEWGDSPLNKIGQPPQPQSPGAAPSFAPRERERVVSPKVDKFDKDKEQAEKTRRWIVDKESPKANDFGRNIGKALSEPVAAVKSAWHGAQDAWDHTMGNDTAPDPKPPVSVMKPNQWKGDKDNPALKENDELNQMRRIAGLKECGDMDVNQPDSMNVSTNMSSEGTKNVTISAQGDKADELLGMLKLAGMQHHQEEEPVAIISTNEEEMVDESSSKRLIKKIGDASAGAKIYKDMEWNEFIVKFFKDGRMLPEETWHHTDDLQDAVDTATSEVNRMGSLDEEYANEPEEEYETISTITRQGNDLNREKKQFSDRPKLGDNPMAESLISLDEELEEMLESIKVKEDSGAGGVSAEQPYRDEKTGKMVYPPKGATMPPPDSEFPPGDPRNSAPLKKKPSMSAPRAPSAPSIPKDSSRPIIPKGMNIEPDDGILNLPMKQRGGK
jgi:hypothetical protein